MVSKPSPQEAIELLQKQKPGKLLKPSPPQRARLSGCNNSHQTEEPGISVHLFLLIDYAYNN
jgi:hypothetical protein